MIFKSAIVMALVVSCIAQRPSYAGRRPIGYPELETTTSNDLGNRFGEGDTGTTERLPLEALGDRELVNRLKKLPIDQQPFWLINWQALEANRKNPQVYVQKPNPFLDNQPPATAQTTVNQRIQSPDVERRTSFDQNSRPIQKKTIKISHDKIRAESSTHYSGGDLDSFF